MTGGTYDAVDNEVAIADESGCWESMPGCLIDGLHRMSIEQLRDAVHYATARAAMEADE